jgi:hypothetical protein
MIDKKLETAQDALEAIRAVVNVRGADYTYRAPVDPERVELAREATPMEEPPTEGDMCRYIDFDGNPSCLVGQIVYDYFGEREFKKLARVEGESAIKAIDTLELPISPEAAIVLTHAQEQQDYGVEYGRVLEILEEEVRENI